MQFDGNPAYGRITNFVYDATIQNRLYATTLEKHLLVSNDNGANWTVLYTLPYENYAGQIQNMRLAKNNTALSFVEFYGPGSSLNVLTVLELQTLSVLKQYSMPEMEIGSNFGDYGIFDDGTLNTVTIFASNETDYVYHTKNGGTTWHKVFDASDYKGVIVNGISIDHNNSNKILIARNGGAGNVDGGLLISSDSGETWSLKLDGMILQSVAVNPHNSNDIYAGTGLRWTYLDQEEELYHSTDGGETWTTIPFTWYAWETTGPLNNIQAIVFNPTNANNIIVWKRTKSSPQMTTA